jgi:hypothetical protein
MPDFKNGKIYEIVCNKTGWVYVGSTAEKRFSSRMSKHRADFKMWKNGTRKSPCKSSLIIDNGDYTERVIEYYECTDKIELMKRETHWYHIYKETHGELLVNKQVPYYTTSESRKEAKKEQDKKGNKKWYEENKEWKMELNKKWRDANKEQCQKQNKKWRDDNPEKVKETNKKSNAIHNAKNKGVFIQCELCNELTSKANIKAHTKKCLINCGGLCKINIF